MTPSYSSILCIRLFQQKTLQLLIFLEFCILICNSMDEVTSNNLKRNAISRHKRYFNLVLNSSQNNPVQEDNPYKSGEIVSKMKEGNQIRHLRSRRYVLLLRSYPNTHQSIKEFISAPEVNFLANQRPGRKADPENSLVKSSDIFGRFRRQQKSTYGRLNFPFSNQNTKSRIQIDSSKRFSYRGNKVKSSRNKATDKFNRNMYSDRSGHFSNISPPKKNFKYHLARDSKLDTFSDTSRYSQKFWNARMMDVEKIPRMLYKTPDYSYLSTFPNLLGHRIQHSSLNIKGKKLISVKRNPYVFQQKNYLPDKWYSNRDLRLHGISFAQSSKNQKKEQTKYRHKSLLDSDSGNRFSDKFSTKLSFKHVKKNLSPILEEDSNLGFRFASPNYPPFRKGFTTQKNQEELLTHIRNNSMLNKVEDLQKGNVNAKGNVRNVPNQSSENWQKYGKMDKMISQTKPPKLADLHKMSSVVSKPNLLGNNAGSNKLSNLSGNWNILPYRQKTENSVNHNIYEGPEKEVLRNLNKSIVHTEKVRNFGPPYKEVAGKNSTTLENNKEPPTTMFDKMENTNLARKNETIKKEAVSVRSNKNDFIHVQLFGDFDGNNILERPKKESKVKDKWPKAKSMNYTKNKRQEALFIIMALFGVTGVILSIACLALILTRRKKRKKSKKLENSAKKKSKEKKFDENGSVSRVQLVTRPKTKVSRQNDQIANESKISKHYIIKEKKNKDNQRTVPSSSEEVQFTDSDTSSENESKEVETRLKNKRIRHSLSVPNNVCNDFYPVERKLYKDINDKIDLNSDSKVVYKHAYEDESDEDDIEGPNFTANFRPNRYQSRHVPNNAKNLPSNNVFQNEMSYVSLNMGRCTPDLRNSTSYDEPTMMGSFEVEQCKHVAETAENQSIKYKTLSNISMGNLGTDPVDLEPKLEFLSYNKGKEESRINFAVDSVVKQPVKNQQSENNIDREIISADEIDTGVNLNNQEFSEKGIQETPVRNNEDASKHVNSPEWGHTSKKRTGSPWDRILANVKPRAAAQKNRSAERDSSTKNVITGQNVEKEKTTVQNHQLMVKDQPINDNNFFKHHVAKVISKNNQSARYNSWIHMINNIKRYSADNVKKPTILSTFTK